MITSFADLSTNDDYRIAKYKNRDVLILRRFMYLKQWGRAYRSYWRCLDGGDFGCEGELMLNELRGGSLTESKKHCEECVERTRNGTATIGFAE